MSIRNKIIFATACFLCVALSANAQRDTLQKYPYIYCYNCPETGILHDSVSCVVKNTCARFSVWPGDTDFWIYPDLNFIYAQDFAVYQNSETSLHAVGIAFGYQHSYGLDYYEPITYTIILSLYDTAMNLQRRIMTAPFMHDWHIWYTDSNYLTLTLPGKYLNRDYYYGSYNLDTTLIVLKKAFFDEPIDISGEFYLGLTVLDLLPADTNLPYDIRDIPFFFEDHAPPYHFPDSKIRILWNKAWYDRTTRCFPELFLIIDPDYHGVSSVPEIETPNPTIEIYPNPATEQVEVTSSLPMARIVATDALGHRLLDRPATGLKTTLDVSRWPAGAYLLQVHTATGIASRKLLVQ